MRSLVVDIGSSNVKIYLAKMHAGKALEMKEADRFPTERSFFLGHLSTDIFAIYDRICRVISSLAKQGISIDSIGIDSWCSDFGILDLDSGSISMPVFYRDSRTMGAVEKVEAVMGYEEICRRTGQRKLRDSTLCQLLAYMEEYPQGLWGSKKLLFLGDMLMYLFTGVACSELSVASYSQLFNMQRGEWDRHMLARYGIPEEIMPPVVQPGTRVGTVREDLARYLGIGRISAVMPAVHDTASAGAAVPAEEGRTWAFLATGSWFLMSMELDAPADAGKSYRYQLSNTKMAFGKVLLKKNITAMWLVQECRKRWKEMGLNYEYGELKEMACRAEPFRGMIDTEYEGFRCPEDMVHEICSYLKETGQEPPEEEDAGQIVRIIYESIALQSAAALEMLEDAAGRKTEVLYVIGGANRIELLNQLLADVTGLTVKTGPAEASAVGNALLQAYGMGMVGSLGEMRSVSEYMCRAEEYRPKDTGRWKKRREEYGRFKADAEIRVRYGGRGDRCKS
ncbi:rhamnulokinase [Dorea sp. D27]|uniref:rhamnulokinase n=1 Tax=Dorea sp. D27 TaxID=658665 RepID=UPI000673A73F|nr:rhamnulokinase family protein [Dorea sp. D27]KMZ54190.1 rhamnulokinase (Rhamnulose kinase) [Dorea sp. D27]